MFRTGIIWTARVNGLYNYTRRGASQRKLPNGGEAVIDRCRDNLNDGYRPVLVTLVNSEIKCECPWAIRKRSTDRRSNADKDGGLATPTLYP
jgi:hypothetical protein